MNERQKLRAVLVGRPPTFFEVSAQILACSHLLQSSIRQTVSRSTPACPENSFARLEKERTFPSRDAEVFCAHRLCIE